MSQAPSRPYRRCAACAPTRCAVRIAALPPVVSRLYHYTTQRPNRAFVTIRPFVSRPGLLIARPSRASRWPLSASRSPLRERRLCRALSRSYRGRCYGRVVAQSSRIVAEPTWSCAPLRCPTLLCHDTIPLCRD